MAKYQAKPVIVDAYRIIAVRDDVEPGRFILTTQEYGEAIATKEMTSRMTPKSGDYWVVQSDGYIYLNPKDVFERKYGPVEMGALELGAAVRAAGLEGKQPCQKIQQP